MNNWIDILKNEVIYYITPDVKRGVGLEDILPNFHIICSFSDPLTPILRKQGAKIFCLEEEIKDTDSLANNSGKLLEHPKVTDYIQKQSKDKIPGILIFKPSLKVEVICQEKGYNLLVNKFSLNDLFEDKTNYFKLISKELPLYSIPGQLGYLKNIVFQKIAKKWGLPIVVQFSHGWAGKTTFFIKCQAEFNELARRFPETFVRINKFIDGFTVLNNACVYKEKIFISPPAIQINNIPEIFEKPEVTCGRQWPAFLDSKQVNNIRKISERIGYLMRGKDYLGYFGLDFLVEGRTGRIYLSENNARFTASSSFYTKLELRNGEIPLLVYHLLSFLKKYISIDEKNSEIIGSQLIFRNSKLKFKINSDINYAVIKHQLGKYRIVRSDYYPQNLASDEFIFSKRYKLKVKNIDNERARIETNTPVLEQPGVLKKWVKKFIG